VSDCPFPVTQFMSCICADNGCKTKTERANKSQLRCVSNNLIAYTPVSKLEWFIGMEFMKIHVLFKSTHYCQNAQNHLFWHLKSQIFPRGACPRTPLGEPRLWRHNHPLLLYKLSLLLWKILKTLTVLLQTCRINLK